MPLHSLPLLLVLVALPVHAQEDVVIAEDPPTSRDIRVLRAIYNVETPAFSALMRGADWSSVKTFVVATPALWLGTLAFDDERDFQPAYLMTLTEAGTIGLVFGLKNVIQRPRPYASLADITARSEGHQSEDVFDPYSFPSGHAAVSFALATSVSLSFPEWYVIVPSALWATAVSVSRSWLGVHYPTDTAIGALMGIGVAFGVHALGDLITPNALRGDTHRDDDLIPRPAPPTVRFVIPIR